MFSEQQATQSCLQAMVHNPRRHTMADLGQCVQALQGAQPMSPDEVEAVHRAMRRAQCIRRCLETAHIQGLQRPGDLQRCKDTCKDHATPQRPRILRSTGMFLWALGNYVRAWVREWTR